jgi:hypothetical protein
MVALHGVLHYALGWEKQEIRTYLSALHTRQQDWRGTAPAGVSKKAKDSFLQWQSFYTQLPEVLRQHGVGARCWLFAATICRMSSWMKPRC